VVEVLPKKEVAGDKPLHLKYITWYNIFAMFDTTNTVEYFVLHLTPLFVVNIANWGVGQIVEKLKHA